MSSLARIVLALVAASAALPAAAQGQPCRSDDLVCRVDALERRLAEMERAGGRPIFAPPPAPRASITTPVNRDCNFQTCDQLALSICKSAGFARGVPAELGTGGVWPRLVSATCLD